MAQGTSTGLSISEAAWSSWAGRTRARRWSVGWAEEAPQQTQPSISFTSIPRAEKTALVETSYSRAEAWREQPG